jgi:hypothetical protein
MQSALVQAHGQQQQQQQQHRRQCQQRTMRLLQYLWVTMLQALQQQVGLGVRPGLLGHQQQQQCLRTWRCLLTCSSSSSCCCRRIRCTSSSPCSSSSSSQCQLGRTRSRRPSSSRRWQRQLTVAEDGQQQMGVATAAAGTMCSSRLMQVLHGAMHLLLLLQLSTRTLLLAPPHQTRDRR